VTKAICLPREKKRKFLRFFASADFEKNQMFRKRRENAFDVKGRFFRRLKRKKITRLKSGENRPKRPKNMRFFHFEFSSETPILRFLARLQFQRYIFLMFRAQE
jgi:hypothetical protein